MSYAPRPMIMSVVVDSRVIIVVKDVKDWEAVSQHIMSKGAPLGGMQVAQGLTHLEQGQRSTGVGQTDSLRGTNRLRAIARTEGLLGLADCADESSVGAGMRRGVKIRRRLGAMCKGV